MQNLFAYGTLMCAAIMREVSGLSTTQMAGVVKDYSRRAVKGECYPALVADDGSQVDGVVYCGISAVAWNRLDRFEGELYSRRLVAVELNDGSITDAFTYVIRPNFRRMLSEKDWDYAAFLQDGIVGFKRRYCGYSNLD